MQSNDNMVLTVVVLGASGDLAKKKTYPSLLDIFATGLFPTTRIQIVGYARSPKTSEKLRETLRPYLLKRKNIAEGVIDQFLTHCTYFQGGYDNAEDFARLSLSLEEFEKTNVPETTGAELRPNSQKSSAINRLWYFAIPPNVFVDSSTCIKQSASDNAGWTRLIVEKPFGKDYRSAEKLCSEIAVNWSEDSIYRIDHYLGKEIVQNLLILRFANAFLEPIWNRHHISAVHVSFKEDFGTEGRGGYFDKFGIVRDVIQNHLMQVVSLIAMECPTAVIGPDSGTAIRDAKVNVLRCIHPCKLNDVVLGQYVANRDQEAETACPGYLEDDGVPADSKTATFATCVLFVNNIRWAGVPFIMTAGKALEERKAEIRVQFKSAPAAQQIFPGQETPQNELVMTIQPDQEIKMISNLKSPGLSTDVVTSELDLTYKDFDDQSGAQVEAYTRLILEVLRGNQAAFVRMDELLEAWRIFTPLLQEVESGRVTPLDYKYGSAGPIEAHRLMAANGYKSPDGLTFRQHQVRHIGPHAAEAYFGEK